MRYVVTGPSRISERDREVVSEEVARWPDVEQVTTGGAYGVDVHAACEAVANFPSARHRVVTPAAAYASEVVVGLSRLYTALQVFALDPVPDETAADAYRRRNHAMFEPLDPEATMLVAFLRRLTWYRSGEWMTVGIAKRLSVPVHYVVLGAR